MKHLIILLLIIFTFPLAASDEFKIQAVASDHYKLTKNGFVKSKPQQDIWRIIFTNNSYSLVLTTTRVPLNILQTDENTISLSQSVLFSGTRVFTFFRKTKKFTFQETGYSDFPEIRKSRNEMPENISISYGSYNIE